MWSKLRQALPGRARRDSAHNDAWNPSGWWWCLDHDRPENPPDAPGHRRLGPYDTAAAAADWRSRLDARNEQWDEEDRRWRGKPEPSA